MESRTQAQKKEAFEISRAVFNAARHVLHDGTEGASHVLEIHDLNQLNLPQVRGILQEYLDGKTTQDDAVKRLMSVCDAYLELSS